jgi:hypothetical protein
MVQTGDLAVVAPGAQQTVGPPHRRERILDRRDPAGAVGSQHPDLQRGAHEKGVALDPDRLGAGGEERGEGGGEEGESEQRRLNN